MNFYIIIFWVGGETIAAYFYFCAVKSTWSLYSTIVFYLSFNGDWFGVIFSKLGEDFARHPAQLYEAFSYIIIFFIVAHIYWRTDKLKKTGYLFGLFFVLLWSSRFIVEFFKQAQVDGREDWILGMNTGQTLSIPFIIIGLYLMFKKTAKS